MPNILYFCRWIRQNAKLHILTDNKHYGYNKIVKNDKIKRKHQQSGYS